MSNFRYTCFSSPTTQELKDELGWYDGDSDKKAEVATTSIMLLCDKIAYLENVVAKQQEILDRLMLAPL